MEIIKQGVITKDNTSKFRYNAWPSVVTLADGTLLCAWSGSRYGHVCPFGQVKAARSTDGGHTWQPPYTVIDTPLDDRDAGLCVLPDGKILLTSFTNSRETQRMFANNPHHNKTATERAFYEGYMALISDETEQRYLGSTIAVSTDNGYTFSEPTLLPISSPHGPCVLNDGRILYVGRRFRDKTPAAFAYLDDGIYAAFLNPDGSPCDGPALICADPGHEPIGCLCEPHAAVMPNGDILVAIRVERPGKQYTTYLCRSTDNGKTWSVPQPTGTLCAPPHLFVTKDNEVVMSYGRRCEPFGQYATISRDNGYTWSEEMLLKAAPNFDLGYPCTTQNANGELVTVYYQKENDGAANGGPNLIHYTVWKSR